MPDLAAALAAAARAVTDGGRLRAGPAPTATPEQIAKAVRALDVLPAAGVGLEAALAEVAELVVAQSVDPGHPLCAAHLHCPPLPAALAGEAVAAATNQSLDSWDQGPAAVEVERAVIAGLCEKAEMADGVFTTGGTQSNLMGMLLARDHGAGSAWNVGARGLPPQHREWRVLCSAAAHFSVARAAAVLGLGERAVVAVAADGDGRMDLAALDRELGRVPAPPLAIVATAGTTDFGAIDPLPAIAERARDTGAWLHVDAAYGGALLLSATHRGLLDGLDQAHSVAIDFHKLGWQPAACGVFLVRDPAAFAPLSRSVAYLNAPDDEAFGYTSQLGRSLATTRRPDALKLLVTFRALGIDALGERVDRCIALARRAADRVAAEPRLAAAHEPVLSTLVFRYLPDDPARADAVNAGLRRGLLASGRAVIGRTEVAGRVHLKLTFCHPDADPDALIDAVLDAAGDAW